MLSFRSSILYKFPKGLVAYLYPLMGIEDEKGFPYGRHKHPHLLFLSRKLIRKTLYLFSHLAKDFTNLAQFILVFR